MSANLQRLVGLVDEKLKAANAEVGAYAPNDRSWHQRHAAAMRQIADELIAGEGAKFADHPVHDHRMQMAGIRTSCSSGLSGLLANWQAAARKRIAKEAI